MHFLYKKDKSKGIFLNLKAKFSMFWGKKKLRCSEFSEEWQSCQNFKGKAENCLRSCEELRNNIQGSVGILCLGWGQRFWHGTHGRMVGLNATHQEQHDPQEYWEHLLLTRWVRHGNFCMQQDKNMKRNRKIESEWWGEGKLVKGQT